MALCIHTHLHPRRTGISVHVEEILPALASLGIEVAALGEGIQDGVPQLTDAEIVEHLEQGKALLWHAHRPKSLRKGLRLRKRYPQIRVVWTHHGWRRPGWLTRLSLRKADAVVALTQEGARQLEQDATIIAHGITLPRQPSLPAPERPLSIGIVGRVRPSKGHREVVEAFLSLMGEFPDWQLRFCGEIRPQHRRFAKGLLAQGKGRISHHPYEISRPDLYGSLSIVVMPSHAEGFSLVVPEAMAYGCALLTSKLPHFGVLFKEEVHALTFETGNSKDLERQLRRLMENRGLRSELVRAAQNHAESNLGINAEATALASLYAEVLKTSA